MIGGLAAKAASVLVTGVTGAAAYDGAKRVVRSGAVRSAAVTMTSWGLLGARAAETGAERARLTAADIVSEARGRIGEEAPAPGTASDSERGHDH